MNLNDMTIGQIKEINYLFGSKSENHPYVIGRNYLIRTVTHYYVGTLVSVFQSELELGNASWIPDTGRYMNCIQDGTFSEVEPIKSEQVIIGRGAIIDCVHWKKELPKEQK
jgi:hypothetical protein